MVKKYYISNLILYRKIYRKRWKGWQSAAYGLSILPFFLISISIFFLDIGNVFTTTQIPGVIIGKVFAIPFVLLLIFLSSRIKLKGMEARKYFEFSAKIGKWLPILLLTLSILSLIVSFLFTVRK